MLHTPGAVSARGPVQMSGGSPQGPSSAGTGTEVLMVCRHRAPPVQLTAPGIQSLGMIGVSGMTGGFLALMLHSARQACFSGMNTGRLLVLFHSQEM